MKVLLLHASLGWGHKRAAMALAEVFEQRGVEADVKDLLEFLPPPLNNFYPWAYSFMVSRSRPLWRAFYTLNDKPASPYAPANSISQRWQFSKLLKYLQGQSYTHIISTHFTSSALLLDWRKKFNWSQNVFSVVTDYTSHRCWKRDGLDLYFVATDDVKSQLIDCGFAASSVAVTGIPISSVFSSLPSRDVCRKLWGVMPDETMVLVLSSGLNDRKTRKMIEDLRTVQGKIKYLVSAGKEAPREQRVKQLCSGDPRFTIFGFSPKIAEMMNAADVLVSKPGGLTVSEALALGLPQIMFSPIPGQEEANAEYVSSNGAGICIENQFHDALAAVLKNGSRLQEMKSAARRLGKPHAAETIVDQIFSYIATSPFDSARRML